MSDPESVQLSVLIAKPGGKSDFRTVDWPMNWRLPVTGDYLFLDPERDSGVQVEVVQFWLRDGQEPDVMVRCYE